MKARPRAELEQEIDAWRRGSAMQELLRALDDKTIRRLAAERLELAHAVLEVGPQHGVAVALARDVVDQARMIDTLPVPRVNIRRLDLAAVSSMDSREAGW